MPCLTIGMNTMIMAEGLEIKCPTCNSEAVYKYGKTWAGKQRFLCLICGRQFTIGIKRTEVKGKPLCPRCGRLMHLYMRSEEAIRFRCSYYPICKTYKKVKACPELVSG